MTPTLVIDLDDLLRGERHENEHRKNLTPTEAVALGKLIEERDQKLAKDRQREHGGTAPGRHKNTSVKRTQVKREQTRDRVAAAVGVSGPTYQRAKAVVTAAEADPSRFGDLPAQMDETESLAGARWRLQATGRRPTGGAP